ncbi:4Fe-4S cluster-binding domain-containing protein [Candidatus Kaiserbacteria bacterium]|nr:4Fe-4S cluster-binding domain-containing protein [Candidatus Kaiserbacteria bacterium]
MTYETEVVESQGVCCANTRTLDHFCGNGSLLKKGMRSRCNECDAEVSAEAWKSNDNPPRVYLRKYCPEHGVTSSRLSSDAAFYFVPKDGAACGCGPGGCGPAPLGENAKAAAQLHTCTLVVEIVTDCNLACPTCYAGSPQRKPGTSGTYLSLADFKAQILGVLAKQAQLDIVQLSGGEPTLHPQLFDILDWLGAQEGVDQVLLNTNGTKLVDEAFVRQLAAHAPKGKFGVYLQYDGVEAAGQTTLRGGDFRAAREVALAHCARYHLPVALVMTVTHENKFSCAGALERALGDDNITWVVYQPEFLSGRNDKQKLLETPINVADIVHSVARGGVMDKRSWMPLPCSDPNCGTVGFMVRKEGAWHPVSKFVDLGQFTPLIANRVNYDVDNTLANCGCDEFNLGDYLTKFGISRADIKMVFIKPFMDTRTWDSARIAACCTHVLTPEGTVDSFCRYYASR